MARPRKDAQIDLSEAHDLTVGLIERLTCPALKTQVFLRDAKAPGLRVRATTAGAKSFVFEAKLNRQTIRRTIGDVRAWNIDAARTEANRMRVTLDGGADPREIQRQQDADRAVAEAAAVANSVTFAEAWAVYLEERKARWGERHYADHVKMARAGGEISTRGTRGRGVTIPGPLNCLLPIPLRELSGPRVEMWAAKEAQSRPATARLAWRQLKAFLGWCAEQPAYAPVVSERNPAKSTRTRESLGKARVKQDALLKEQLPAWFIAVRDIGNPVISAYLQILLLTGARPGEVLALRWEDVNSQWRSLTINDKVEGTRVIPLTPYVNQLLSGLPRRNQWVFFSPGSGEGALTIPRKPHVIACKAAGLEGLTLHGLRRSFKSLTEWLDVPSGIVAQIMGHKPSATAEKHYTVRPLDLLRVHHERIEAWILEQARVHVAPHAESDQKALSLQ